MDPLYWRLRKSTAQREAIDDREATMPGIHSEQSETWEPALSQRTAPNRRTSVAVARLWRAAECYDLGVLERVARSLRDLDTGSEYRTRTQHEIDGVIARYRATHPEAGHVR
ncbi:hypothetical protein [Nocardia sp. NPDC019395]|uniref:hypothetical protein n=1 Tax=Nocardia sp. NPDC019395 TaxID=3154686 RepID=UPI0033C47F49